MAVRGGSSQAIQTPRKYFGSSQLVHPSCHCFRTFTPSLLFIELLVVAAFYGLILYCFYFLLHFSGNFWGIPSRLSLWLMSIFFFRCFIVAFCFCHISYRFWTICWDPFCYLGDVLLYHSPTKEILLDLCVPSVCERSLANESIG